MASKNITELIRKVKALAEKGVGGEKANAQRMLERLLKEHDISLAMIEAETTKDFIFKYKSGERRLLGQIIGMIMGCDVSIYKARGRTQGLFVKCTHSQFLEIEVTFEFYAKAYRKQLELFTGAFIQTNELFPESDQVSEDIELTLEQRQMLEMSQYIPKTSMQKRLTT